MKGNNEPVDANRTIDFFINGQPATAFAGETVIQAARRAGVAIPHFCWHPELSVPGNCRICMVEVEQERGDPWFDIGCNMPVTAGMRVLTESENVKRLRRDTMQFITLNHPVDCGICNKAGECILQDYHYEHNGRASQSIDRKNHATKFFPLSDRIMLDNERCIMCTRCVRFTHEVSKSHALGAVHRGDHALIRPAEDANFNEDMYSDNVIDICPVGALLSRTDLDHSRVWYTKPTPSVCPGCSRGCSINLWHRKPEWAFKALDARLNTRIERVTPLDNPAVNGPWVCNKARDLAAIFERPRATQAMVQGRAVALGEATAAAAALLATAKRVVALVSSWGSNEELAAFADAFTARLGRDMMAYVKPDHLPQPGEVVADDLLIRADKNPNTRGATAYFPMLPAQPAALLAGADLVLVWGEGVAPTSIPVGPKVIRLDAYAQEHNAQADVFVPISIQTERHGHYTNFEGAVTGFAPCFAPAPTVGHAEQLFRALSTAHGKPTASTNAGKVAKGART
ncbi:MAG: 2Fe-2S iron-sulfur cluster-binding protein [Gemmatimonas sp.]|jgi:NADH-quinone oxidoreductase subunit G|uniref:2Fe-2S iron-sulfur cluster-binding protein n=1 Tax=Gemmatimonas sp. TaxID=1962908 RepID=UPI00391F5419|nr:2Fe-2S iron-sulfur cluster-binding protein [Gemmatimonadota bacterium]